MKLGLAALYLPPAASHYAALNAGKPRTCPDRSLKIWQSLKGLEIDFFFKASLPEHPRLLPWLRVLLERMAPVDKNTPKVRTLLSNLSG